MSTRMEDPRTDTTIEERRPSVLPWLLAAAVAIALLIWAFTANRPVDQTNTYTNPGSTYTGPSTGPGTVPGGEVPLNPPPTTTPTPTPTPTPTTTPPPANP